MEVGIEPDDTDVFEDLSLSVEPLRFIDPPQSNSGTAESPIVSLVAMEFGSNPDAGQYIDTVEAASRKRVASTVHSEAPPSKVMSVESSGVLGSGKQMRRKTKLWPNWGVVHDNQTYTSFEFLAQFPDEYRSLYGNAEPA
ncbi:hypothetical protein C8R45DRAFT_1098987 [Mycena sanguinolenta]|nr:hypothetical protein C8R45DRAFT_1098987 [Mycena sanguinolenta]